MNNLIRTIAVLFILTMSLHAHAAVTGPFEVVVGGLGSGPGQFGVYSDTTGITAPAGPFLGGDGKIVIADQVNRRVSVFNADGTSAGSFGPPATVPETEAWPASVTVPLGSNTVVVKTEGKVFVHDLSGQTLAVIETPAGCEVLAADDGFIVYDLSTDLYRSFNLQGTETVSSAEAPPELGVYEGGIAENGEYRQTVTFPDRTYSFVIPQKGIAGFQRDVAGNLLVAAVADNSQAVYMVDPEGTVTVRTSVPGSVKSGTGETLADYVARYGDAAFGPDGAVYASRLTQSGFAVLKWKMQ